MVEIVLACFPACCCSRGSCTLVRPIKAEQEWGVEQTYRPTQHNSTVFTETPPMVCGTVASEAISSMAAASSAANTTPGDVRAHERNPRGDLLLSQACHCWNARLHLYDRHHHHSHRPRSNHRRHRHHTCYRHKEETPRLDWHSKTGI